MTWNRPEPVIDYAAFERGEPIVVSYDLLYDNVKKLKSRIRSWLAKRDYKHVIFVTERRHKLHNDTLIAYWSHEQQTVDYVQNNPAYVFFTQGAYEHKLATYESECFAGVRKSTINWLKKHGAEHVSTRIDYAQGIIYFWNPTFDPLENQQ